MKYQFTLFQVDNKYKPVSYIVEAKPQEKFMAMRDRAIDNICAKRHWTRQDLIKYGYTKVKYRKIED